MIFRSKLSEVRSNLAIQELKEKQKLRHRPNGVNIVGLALGKKVTMEEEVSVKDPFNVKMGGMVNMSALKAGKMKPSDDAYDTGIGTQFSAETNTRDEDQEMMKFIDEELRRKKGLETDPTDGESSFLTPEENALRSLPKHLRLSSSHKSEEMLSNQMLNGIPEVDLGIDAKIKNIEATEEAKQKLLWERKNKKDLPSQFVPKNYAVNFVQHNRFNIEHNEPKKRPNPQQEDPNRQNPKKRATDDFVFDKFKKQFRRH